MNCFSQIIGLKKNSRKQIWVVHGVVNLDCIDGRFCLLPLNPPRNPCKTLDRFRWILPRSNSIFPHHF